MTYEESWALLTELCTAINNDDFAKVKELTQNNLTTLDEWHYSAILEGIELTPDFVTKEIDYLRKFLIALHDQEFKSFRSAMRVGFLQTYIDDINSKEVA